MISNKNKLIGLLILLFGVFLLPVQAVSKSASLYFSPNSGTYEIGQDFSIRVSVDTGGENINAVEDVLSFSKDTLEITSISKEETLISLWVIEPVYNNSTGKINFTGGISTPGFNGLGSLFKVYFKSVGTGPAWISYSSGGKVLANDGLGTNLLASIGTSIFDSTVKADFTIVAKSVDPILNKSSAFANLNDDVDETGNHIVNLVDVSILLSNWGTPIDPRTSLNNDNIVDLTDFSILLSHWTG